MLLTPNVASSDVNAILDSHGAGGAKAARRRALYGKLLFLDMVALLLGGGIASLMGMDIGPVLGPLAAVVGAYVCVAVNTDCYSLRALDSAVDSVRRSANALLNAIGLVALVALLVGGADSLLHWRLALCLASGAGLLLVLRAVYPRHARQVLGRRLTSKLVIVDERPAGVWRDADLVIDAVQYSLAPDLNDPVMLDRFGHLALAFDRIVVDCLPERRQEWATLLKGMNVDGEIVVAGLEELNADGIGKACGGRSSVIVSRPPFSLRSRLYKRALDLAVTIPALVFLAPLLALTAIAIKIDTPGPVLFRQYRIGRGNRLFKVLKFRSMRVEGSDPRGMRSTARNDDRVTRVGKIIRATSIDELPQLFNVLLGDMSLVGPRPHPIGSLAEGQLFWHIDIRYWHRHQIKPGITGLAQVRGFRGATHQVSDLTNRLRADLEYIENWSFWRDLKILTQTFGVIMHDNAF